MRRSLTLALVLLPVLAGAAPPVTAIKAGRLLDVANEKVLENVVIVVEDGRVREIGTTVPAGANVIDLGRHHVLPGFIDGHTHVLLQGDATAADYDAQLLKESLPYRALRATRAMRIALDHGFTTLRDIGNEGAGFADVDLKRAVEAGVVAGSAAVRGDEGAGAHRGLRPRRLRLADRGARRASRCATGADACRRAVRDQIAHGADWIKVYADRSYYKQPDGQIRSLPNFTVEEMTAIVDQAHRTPPQGGGALDDPDRPRHRAGRRCRLDRARRRPRRRHRRGHGPAEGLLVPDAHGDATSWPGRAA